MNASILRLLCCLLNGWLLLAHLASYAQQLDLGPATGKVKRHQRVQVADLGFTEYERVQGTDTVRFYTYRKPGTQPTSIYLFLQGTDPTDIYTYGLNKDSTVWWSASASLDFSYLPDDYLFVVVAKPGFRLVGPADNPAALRRYWAKTSLPDRVARARTALAYVRRHLVPHSHRVVVLGYSEGFYVASKLARTTHAITHLGLGGGGGYVDYYDFVLFYRLATLRKEMSAEQAQAGIDSSLVSFRRVLQQPTATARFENGYSYQRWASYAEPPMRNLAAVKIPIYQVHGTEDENVPIENAYLIPLEFIRLGKPNLTFRPYLGCNHALEEKRGTTVIHHWDEMLRDFFTWVRQH